MGSVSQWDWQRKDAARFQPALSAAAPSHPGVCVFSRSQPHVQPGPHQDCLHADALPAGVRRWPLLQWLWEGRRHHSLQRDLTPAAAEEPGLQTLWVPTLDPRVIINPLSSLSAWHPFLRLLFISLSCCLSCLLSDSHTLNPCIHPTFSFLFLLGELDIMGSQWHAVSSECQAQTGGRVLEMKAESNAKNSLSLREQEGGRPD